MRSLFFRLSKSNNQQLGYVLGMFVGIGMGFYALGHHLTPVLPLIGSLDDFSIGFVKALLIPFSGGLFANIFSNLGAGIDILTNEKTLFNGWISYNLDPDDMNK